MRRATFLYLQQSACSSQDKMPLFKSSPKSPQDLVKNLRDALQVLSTTEGGGKKSDKVSLLLFIVLFIIFNVWLP